MSSEELQSFDDCDTEDEARELIAQRYNNIVVEAMEADFDPMFVARELRDHSGATVVALHSTSIRQQMGADEDDSDSSGFTVNGGEHPLQ